MLNRSDESFVNSTADVTCDPGFDPNTTTITCLETSKWEKAECISRCKTINRVSVKLNEDLNIDR